MAKPSYHAQIRIVAFLDILGFRDQTKRCLDDPRLLEALDRSLMSTDMLVKPYQGYTTDARMFSDCICVSSPFESGKLFKFIYTLEAVQMNLACSGVFIRGAIAIGRHFESPRMILSEALIEAYLLESREAQFPRIIASEATAAQIVAGAKAASEPDLWDDTASSLALNPDVHLRRDEDGQVFLSYLMSLRRIDRSAIILEYISRHKEAVTGWIRDGRARDVEHKVRAKHEWVRVYHNMMLRELFPGGYIDDDLIDE